MVARAGNVALRGSLVALVTPMQPDGSVDFDALRKLVDFHVEAGSDGLVAMGTTGESATLDFDEHVEVIEATIRFAAGRIPVIAGTGANSTHEALELTKASKEVGAVAHLSVTPYYNKPPQEGLIAHFTTIADGVDLPLILYNVPGRTAVDLRFETTLKLSEHGNIVGIKEATGSLERIRELIDATGPDFAVYSGEDSLGCACMLAGGQGSISVTANVAPALMHRMSLAALAGDHETAEGLDAKLAGLHRELFCQTNPIPVKWAVHQMGLIGPTLRLPMIPLAADCQPRVRQAMIEADVAVG